MASAHVEVGEDGSVHDVHAVLDIASIDTGHAKRDSDLGKPGLLDLANHPVLTFSGTQITPVDEAWSVTGALTAKGMTREITLEASAQRQSDDTVRVRLTGQLDRRDYGVRAPRFLIGTLVDIEIEATFGR